MILPLHAALAFAMSAAADANAPAPPTTLSSLSAKEAAEMVVSVTPRVEEHRGLKFKKPVPVQVVDDAAAREHFKARMKKHWPESQVRMEQTAYIQLGLLPGGTDLTGTLFSVLEEQVGGYYDPESDTFFVLGDMPRSIAPILMVHELTHALDDQYYDIDKLIERTERSNDASAAVGAVVEGSGTLVMTRYILTEMQAGRMSPDILQELAGSDAGRAEKLMASPAVLQRSLVASYVLGQTFMLRGDLMRVTQATPVADLDRAFTEVPVSTEQILHPEKYWDAAAKDLPRTVKATDASKILGDGWSLLGDGQLGELTLAVITGADAVNFKSADAAFPAKWTNAAASGWGGDAWQLYGQGDHRATVLTTLWDTPKDAEEFEAVLTAHPAGVSRTVKRAGDVVVVVAGDAGDKAGAVADAALAR